MPLEIALAQPADAADLAAVLVDCLRGGASVGFLAGVSLADARAFRDAALPVGTTLVARLDGAVVGVVRLQPAPLPDAVHRAEVAKLLVHRSARRRGVAVGLLVQLEDEARAQGRWLLVLDTVTSSPAERLYAGLGWERVGVVEDYAALPDGTLAPTTYFAKRLAQGRGQRPGPQHLKHASPTAEPPSVKASVSPGRRRLQHDMRRFVQESGATWTLWAGAALTAVSIVWLLLLPGRTAHVMAGAFAVLAPGLTWYLVVVYGEFGSRLAGLASERQTLKVLRSAVKKGAIWSVTPFHRLATGPDVDMLVIAPRGVLAMEVKWHGSYMAEDKLDRSAVLAARSARRLGADLRRKGLSPHVDVLPVLVVWGPAADLVRDGARRYLTRDEDGVTVVDGRDPSAWLPKLATGRVSEDSADHVRALLTTGPTPAPAAR